MINDFLLTQTSANTRKTYAAALSQFEAWLTQRSAKLSDVTPRDIDAYRSYLLEQFGAATTANRLAALRSFTRWAYVTEQLPAAVYSATTAIKSPKIEQPLPTLLTEEELQDLFCQPDTATVAGARDLAILLFLSSSGCRLSEATGLTFECVDLNERRAKVTGKGSKDRIVFFDTQTQAALVHFLHLRDDEQTGYIFTNKDGGRISDRWIQDRISEYGARIGRPDLHPHLLRHCYATDFLDKTGDLKALQVLLGHKQSSTTDLYTRLAVGRIESVYRAAKESGNSYTSPAAKTRIGIKAPPS